MVGQFLHTFATTAQLPFSLAAARAILRAVVGVTVRTTSVVPWLVGLAVLVLSACSLDRTALVPRDGGSSGGSGGVGGGSGDSGAGGTAGVGGGFDAGPMTDAARDSSTPVDGSDEDAGGDAGDGAIVQDAGDGSVGGCTTDDDCPSLDCAESNCTSGRCDFAPLPFGPLPAEQQTAHDCRTEYCDGNGARVSLPEPMDPPADDGEFCTLEACVNGTPARVSLSDGTQLPASQQVPGDCRVKRCTGGVTVDVASDADLPPGDTCNFGTCSGGVTGLTPRSPGLICGTDLICDDMGTCSACTPEAFGCTDDWECCGGDCVGGLCGAGCTSLTADCDNDDNNGCETSIATLSDCGACGVTCATANATPTCSTGTCAIASCNSAFADCNGTVSDGCEQSLRSIQHCGGCNVPCARANAQASCATGTCAMGPCLTGFGNCDSNSANGCETALNTLDNCGSCGTACSIPNASATCSSGTCQRVACLNGFDDCDANAANGCETPLDTLQHCGACGNACSGPANRVLTCSAGMCAVGACATGFQDCDGDDTNGCEWSESGGPCPCVGTADSDGDGLTNCEELGDGDPWTDPDIFNGARVTHYPVCSTRSFSSVNCSDTDTLGEVTACINKTPRQTLDQYSGWDWDDPSGATNPINSAGFGFLPNWSGTDTSFQLDAQAFINITQAGRHCFRINGGDHRTCGSLYFTPTDAGSFCGWSSLPSSTGAVVQHGDSAVCRDLTPGVYPFRWHLDRTSGAQGDFHLDYCFGGNSNCAPTNAVPSRMLRPTYDSDCQRPNNSCSQATTNGRRYWVCSNNSTWSTARTACQSVGMDLAVINNSTENTFLRSLISTDHWIGLTDAATESVWVWAPTGTTVWVGGANGTLIPGQYANWANNEPNGDNTRNCVEIQSNTGGTWNDTTCGTMQPYICEQL